jgi:ParB family transcriptional regulator, chromosome partitioning protein
MQPTLKLSDIVSGPNHRQYFDPQAMKELEEGLKAAGGVTQPIQVRPHPERDGVFEIMAGERRWRAARSVYGDDYDMPVVVREATDAEARALGIIENHFRDDTSDIEQAEGAASLLSYNKGDKHETALQLGWNIDTLERRLLLLHCAPAVRSALNERRIKLGHAELLAGLPGSRQEKVLAGVLDHKVPVEVLKRQLGQFAKRLADAIFDTTQCAACPHNSARQASLFDESIGEGFCQHPSHYEELTMAALETRATPLREQYPVVRFVRLEDGFAPLTVRPDGPMGVGAVQYGACKGCESFGCSVSAITGSYGEINESLCFDAACHSKKVSANRKAMREATQSGRDEGAGETERAGSTRNKAATAATADAGTAKHHIPGKVVTFRVEQWRKWAANALMAQPDRNQRVLAALILAGDTRAVARERYADAATKVAGFNKAGSESLPLRKTLEQADRFDAGQSAMLVQAVAAAAAYGIDNQGLEVLLNYLEVDEAKTFVLDHSYLDLLTVSELESLAEEVGLRKAMGSAYQKARAGKRADFIKGLLAVAGFAYAGAVPKAMRYPRRGFKRADRAGESIDPSQGKSSPGAEPVEAESAAA